MIQPENNGFTLLELIVVIVIISILVLIASSLLLDAAEKTKEAVVRANCSAAASSLINQFADDVDPNIIVEDTVSNLNDPNHISDDQDDLKSPFVKDEPAFTFLDTVSSGQVLMKVQDMNTIAVIGFGKNIDIENPLIVKTVKRL